MARLNIIGEGFTEESCVRLILAPFLGERGIYAVARSVETGRKRSVVRRGGMTDYRRAKSDIVRWLKQDHEAYITTMFDVYALPADFPGVAGSSNFDPYGRVKDLEAAFEADVGDRRFIPYFQLHEFESLLFSDVRSIDAELAIEPGATRLMQLTEIRNGFATPEHIDDGFDTCPSRRLINLFPRYEKATDGIRSSNESESTVCVMNAAILTSG